MSALAQRLSSALPHDIAYLDAEREWLLRARVKQVLPVDGWNLALAQSGRGFGKTLMGSSWVRRLVGMYPGCIVHVVAPTYSDLRGVIFGGTTGLVASIPQAMTESVNHSLFEVKLKNGSLIRGFSSEAPDRLRGPQCTFLWGDEVAAWQNAEETITNIDMSTRIVFHAEDGRLIQPQRFYTTTPRPLIWIKKIIDRAEIVVRGSTYENRANLAASFLRQLEQYEGTQIGRQEIHGELIDISETAIIKRSWLKVWPNDRELPWFEFVMVSMDTAFTERTFNKRKFEADPTACQVWGVFLHNKRYNLMLLECWSDHLGFPDLVARAKKEMKAIYGRRRDILFKPLVGSEHSFEQVKRPDLLIIEEKGSGISLRQQLSNEGIDSWPFNPGNADKTSRLHGVSHVAAAGRIWLPESSRLVGEPRDWVLPMIDELCTFSGPGTTPHDDHVDTASQAWRYFSDRWASSGMAAEVSKDGVEVAISGIVGEDFMPGEYHELPTENPYG